jgi:hypothetical protein
MDLDALRARLPPTLAATLRTGADVERIERERFRGTSLGPWRATSLAPLDALLGGGLKRAALTEVWGPRSSGRLAIGLAALAAATREEESVAWIDLGGGLDPRAACAAGVVLERVLWAQPRTVAEGLIAAEIVASVGLGLVVLDLGLADTRAAASRAHEAPWARLAQAAGAHGSALLVLSPARASGSGAQAVVRIAGARPKWIASGVPPRLLAGLVADLRLEKRRGGFPDEGASLLFVVPEVIDKAAFAARALEKEPAKPRLHVVHSR